MTAAWLYVAGRNLNPRPGHHQFRLPATLIACPPDLMHLISTGCDALPLFWLVKPADLSAGGRHLWPSLVAGLPGGNQGRWQSRSLAMIAGAQVARIEISVFYSQEVEVRMTAAFTCMAAGICGGECASNFWGCAGSLTLKKTPLVPGWITHCNFYPHRGIEF